MHLRSPAALAFAIICIIGTIIVVFGKVVAGTEPPTINHLYIALALTVTLGSGHYMWESFSEGKFGWVLGVFLSILFIVGTIVCVAMSGSRSAAIFEQKEHDFTETTNKRARLVTDIEVQQSRVDDATAKHDQADKYLQEKLAAVDEECSGGEGKICKGKALPLENAKQRTADLYSKLTEATNKLNDLKKDLADIPVPQEPNLELVEMARVYVTIFGGDVQSVKKKLQTVFPYLLALITEFGAIVFNLKAWGERPRIVTQHITLVEIAEELKIPARQARKIVRQLNVPRPPEGWVWKRLDADTIKAQIQSSLNTVH